MYETDRQTNNHLDKQNKKKQNQQGTANNKSNRKKKHTIAELLRWTPFAFICELKGEVESSKPNVISNIANIK